MSILAALGFLFMGIGMFAIIRRSFVSSTFGPIIREVDPISFWGVMLVFGALGCLNIVIAAERFIGILA